MTVNFAATTGAQCLNLDSDENQHASIFSRGGQLMNLGSFSWICFTVTFFLLNISGCKQRDFNSPSSLSATASPTGFKTVAGPNEWGGQIFLPSAEARSNGSIYLKVSQAPESGKNLLGRLIKITWPQWMGSANKYRPDIMFDSKELEQSKKSNNIVATVLDGWKAVSPLESLAAARCFGQFTQNQTSDGKTVSLCNYQPLERIFVRIKKASYIDSHGELIISDEPIVVAGTHVTLISQIEKIPRERILGRFGTYRAQQFINGQFDRQHTIEFLVEEEFGSRPNFTFNNINSSPSGDFGWYLSGEFDSNLVPGKLFFVAKAIEPRSILRTSGTFEAINGQKAGKQFLTYQDNFPTKNSYLSAQGITRSKFASLENNFRKLRIFPSDNNANLSESTPIQKNSYSNNNSPFRIGETGLVVHLFHWISDSKEKKDVGPLGLVTGHYSYGTYEIIKEPLTGDSQFEVTYQQVYGQGPDAVISSRVSRSEYMGNFRRGWSNSIATTDALVRIPWFSMPIDPATGSKNSGFTPEQILNDSLALMTHAYRTGSGDGISSITPWASCVQDSTQALFIALRQTEKILASTRGPQFCQTNETKSMCNLLSDLKKQFEANDIFENAPVRGDWVNNALELQIRRSSNVVENGYAALASYKTALPRNAFNIFLSSMLDQRLELMLMDNIQIGGYWTQTQREATFTAVPATSIFELAKSAAAKVQGISRATFTNQDFVNFLLKSEGVGRLEDLNNRFPHF